MRFSTPRTPLSEVYCSTTVSMVLTGSLSCFAVMPVSVRCLGTKWRLAIWTFSSTVYPVTSMISMRSRRAG